MMYEADDDELTEVDSDASEVEHVVPKKILAHSLQWRHENGSLSSVWMRLQYVNQCTKSVTFFAYDVETFAGGVELLRRWERRFRARVGVEAPPASSAAAPAAIIARSSSSAPVPCTPLLPTLLLPNDGRGVEHLEFMIRDG